jgi:hypothetical protein
MRAEVEAKGGQFALVRFRKAEQEVEALVKQHRDPKAKSRGSRIVSSAYGAGREAGKTVGLHGGLGGGSSSSRGTLARGQMLLGR